MRCFRRFALIGLALALLAGCDGGSTGSSGNQADSGWNGSWDTSFTTQISLLDGNRILSREAPQIFTSCGKVDGLTVLHSDTDFVDDTTVYKLAGNLLLVGGMDSNQVAPGSKIVRWKKYSRSSGTGLFGTWKWDNADSLELVGAALSEGTLERQRALASLYGSTIEGSGFAARTTLSATSSLTEISVPNWARYQAALLENSHIRDGEYLLTLQVKSPVRMSLVGGVTKDTVTVEALSSHEFRYSSTDTARHTYLLSTPPKKVSQCPDDDWFQDFLWANRKKSS